MTRVIRSFSISPELDDAIAKFPNKSAIARKALKYILGFDEEMDYPMAKVDLVMKDHVPVILTVLPTHRKV